jgi:hypothetical protein
MLLSSPTFYLFLIYQHGILIQEFISREFVHVKLDLQTLRLRHRILSCCINNLSTAKQFLFDCVYPPDLRTERWTRFSTGNYASDMINFVSLISLSIVSRSL